MAQKNIHDLDQLLSGIDFDADELALWDADAAVTKRILAKLLMAEYGTQAIIYDETLMIAGSFDIQNIPATFAHLKLFSYLRTDNATTYDGGIIQFNNDSGNNYDATWFSVNANGNLLGTGGDGAGIDHIRYLDASGAGAPANYYGSANLQIPNYANASNYKTCHGDSFRVRAFDGGSLNRSIFGGVWRNIAPINRIQIHPDVGTEFVVGSRVVLYGLNA